jgi:hypothetical protein
VVTFQFPSRGSLPPVKLAWYEGLLAPRPPELEDDAKLPAEGGAILKGTKGTIVTGLYGLSSPQLIPVSRTKDVKFPEPTLPRIQGSHEMDWVRACKAGTRAGADFSYSGPLTEICLLGNVAKRVESRIVWDTEALKITNLPDANKYIRSEYRNGWTL